MRYEVELYEKAGGKTPVLEFILSLNSKQQAKIYREIDLLEKFGNELHYPHVDNINGKIQWFMGIKDRICLKYFSNILFYT